MRKAVFMDRDGVIIEQVAYLSSPEQVALIPGAAEALELIHSRGDASLPSKGRLWCGAKSSHS